MKTPNSCFVDLGKNTNQQNLPKDLPKIIQDHGKVKGGEDSQKKNGRVKMNQQLLIDQLTTAN